VHQEREKGEPKTGERSTIRRKKEKKFFPKKQKNKLVGDGERKRTEQPGGKKPTTIRRKKPWQGRNSLEKKSCKGANQKAGSLFLIRETFGKMEKKTKRKRKRGPPSIPVILKATKKNSQGEARTERRRGGVQRHRGRGEMVSKLLTLRKIVTFFETARKQGIYQQGKRKEKH